MSVGQRRIAPRHRVLPRPTRLSTSTTASRPHWTALPPPVLRCGRWLSGREHRGARMAARLTLHLLGAPEVQLGGAPLAIPRRRTRALLFYLAASGRPHTRAHLTERFWGELPAQAAGRSLSDALYRLRALLGEHTPIAVTSDQIVLRPAENCWIDLAVFEHLLGAASTAVAEAQRELLEAAVVLWRGALLDGFDLTDCPAFDDWLALERRQIEERYLGALGTLADLHAGVGAVDRAITL